MKRFFALLLSLSVMLTLTACGEERSTFDIVSAIVDGETGSPSGMLCRLSATEGEIDYASDTMLKDTYGFDRSLKGLEDGALWLSGGFHPFEAAVFLCRDYRSSEDIALYLKNRLRTLQSNVYEASSLCKMTPEEYRSYVDNGIVLIAGDYVALVISSDPKAAKRVFLNAAG